MMVLVDGYVGFLFFFFKQKTAYEMRISDWSSDVCSSDLVRERDRILEVEDDRVGARRRGLGEAFGAVAGDEEEGTEAHQASFFLMSAERSHWQTISPR